MRVELAPRFLELVTCHEPVRRYHYVWLRDNCWCNECRVVQTAERRLLTWSIPQDIRAVGVEMVDGGIVIDWSDGHRSSFSLRWLEDNDYSQPTLQRAREQAYLWGADFDIPRFGYEGVVAGGSEQLAYLDAVREFGVAIVEGVPTVPGEVERFAEAVGHVREVAFERVHNVYHDPDGYNVAHTPLELKPHSDMPSYHWPPSIQLLHFLANEAQGGESVVVDGWNALRLLRESDPAAFEILSRVPVRYQLFSDTEDTYAISPMVQLDTDREVAMFRFSNQLALPLHVEFDMVEPFYDAYRKLGNLIDNPAAKVVFKARNGDLLTVHSHRVLHGRLPFAPGTGARHLQDVYMEFDDFMARRRVLMGIHKPVPSGAQG